LWPIGCDGPYPLERASASTRRQSAALVDDHRGPAGARRWAVGRRLAQGLSSA